MAEKTPYQSELFKQETPTGFSTINKDGIGGLADYLVPQGTGAVDVINEYRWTLTEKNGRTETPSIVLTEFRLLQSALMNSARYFFTGLGQQVGIGNENKYREMRGYTGLFDFKNSTGFWYRFPYFSDISNEVTSTWVTLDILEKIKSAASKVGLGEALELGTNIAKLGYEANYPRVGVMDRPKLWEQSTPRTINIKVPLYNTVDFADIKRNWDLCYLLLYQNMFNKRDFITAIPPVFYTVYAPGQFFSIAMYVSDLKIYNKGNIRRIRVDDKFRNIPDVYEINITLTDMIMPSQNMLSVLQNEDPVKVQLINDLVQEQPIEENNDVSRATTPPGGPGRRPAVSRPGASGVRARANENNNTSRATTPPGGPGQRPRPSRSRARP
jgi:hypothetical protein